METDSTKQESTRGANMENTMRFSSDSFVQTAIQPGDVQAGTSVAHEIGLCRIALVVDKLCDHLDAHPELAEPFRVDGTSLGHRARLTYLWWVALGGDALRGVELGVEPKQSELDFQMLADWMNAFRQVAASLVERDLADTWMDEVSGLLYAITATTAPGTQEMLGGAMSCVAQRS